jgi:phosphate transport system substrate-binding protein
VAAVLAVAGLGCTPRSSDRMLINGVGATFPYPLYQKWCSEYLKVDNTVQVNYSSQGSGAGKAQITVQTADFGASDGPMTDEELAKAPGKILHIPTVAGADVATYNLPGIPKLKLDGPVLADIFLGKITKWNDPRLTAQNPGVNLPNSDIAVVHRADGSGTTYIWTDYLCSVSKEWETKVGRGVAVSWPAGQGAKGNEGVTGQVKQTPGSIGYVELAYARQNKLAVADIKNAHGEYVAPSIESITKALATATVPEDFRFSMVNPPGEGVYPIAGVTWLLVYEQQKDAGKGKKLVEFLNWALTQGEGMAAALDYAPLPEAVQKRFLERIKTIKY